MLRVNKKLEYGILALLHLAAEPEKMASVREMSSVCNIPETLLSKIMQAMKNRGIVSAVYGNHGGYRLNRDLSQISLLDINEVLVGPVQVAECLEPGNQHCPVKDHCVIVEPMNVLNQKLIRLFQSTSLEALAPRKVAL
jgi:Rrf2 family protein